MNRILTNILSFLLTLFIFAITIAFFVFLYYDMFGAMHLLIGLIIFCLIIIAFKQMFLEVKDWIESLTNKKGRKNGK